MLQLKYAIICLPILMLFGCVDGEEDVHVFVDNIKKTSLGKVKPLPTAKVYDKEEFTAKDLRSAFDIVGVGDKIGSMGGEEVTANSTGAVEQAPRPDAARKREYLERFPLENYVMVGTLSNGKQTWGLVEDKTGMVHPVKVNDYIGVNSGLVVEINEQQIYVVETVENGEGGWEDVENGLELKSEIAADVSTGAK